jgi:hypothetical protein
MKLSQQTDTRVKVALISDSVNTKALPSRGYKPASNMPMFELMVNTLGMMIFPEIHVEIDHWVSPSVNSPFGRVSHLKQWRIQQDVYQVAFAVQQSCHPVIPGR